jgi:3-oxoadipate enol-lactonase
MLINLNGRRAAYDLFGPAGAPVVCMTHSLASDSGMWAEQVPALLDAGYRVLRSDMRGHGGSEATPGEYTMQQLGDDLDALLVALGVERIHLVGLSVGAMLGMAFALARPEKLASLVLCDAQAASGSGARAAWSMPLAMVRQQGSLTPVATGLLRAWLSDAYKAREPQRWQQIRETILATPPAGFEGCVAAMSDFDFTAQLPSLGVPTLVLYGDGDPMTKPDENRRLAELIPGGQAEAIADARHFSNVEQPAAFNRVLLAWLGARR